MLRITREEVASLIACARHRIPRLRKVPSVSVQSSTQAPNSGLAAVSAATHATATASTNAKARASHASARHLHHSRGSRRHHGRPHYPR